MDNYLLPVITFVAGLYLFVGAMVITTNNAISALTFTAIPALIGGGLMLAGLHMAGFL